VLEGLQPDTTYHCRIRARGGMGDLISGEDLTFSTRVREPAGNGQRVKVDTDLPRDAEFGPFLQQFLQ